MNEILIRFPTVGLKIFRQLDNESLAKSKRINKIVSIFLEKGTLTWKRRIQKYISNQIEFIQDWKVVIKKISLELLKELALNVEAFYQQNISKRLESQQSPLFVVASVGNLSLCKYIIERTGNVNPSRTKDFLNIIRHSQ